MKKIKVRSMIVYALSLVFIIGLGYFVFELFTNSESWVTSPINEHLSGEKLSNAGKILDKNNVVLAQSVNGERRYDDDEDIRKALLHTIGDGSIDLSTSIENCFSADLFGYNFVTGLGSPDFFTMKKDIYLTLDSDLCKLASEKLGSNKGAVAVYNYKTGEILCMVSKPTYDPYNKPVINEEDEQYEGVYLNRVLSSSFTPGSTFKVITCACAIENIEDINTRVFHCDGSMEVDGEKITCLEHHGDISFQDGMAKSCNIVFAKLAIELGKDKMTATSNEMGFNDSIKIDRVKLYPSNYNVENASDVDLGWSGIGQQDDLVNPAHMMTIMGAIANDGIPVQPYTVKYMHSQLGINDNLGHAKSLKRMMSTTTAKELKRIMRYTVKNQYGDKMFSGLNVCAKTGTAEVGKNKKPHGWITGFVDDEKLPLAFVAIVENSGYGISTAGPIISDIIAKVAE